MTIKEVQKEVQKQPRQKLNLFILNQLKLGLRPAQISKKFNLKMPRLSYYLSTLLRQGIVINKAYGVWELTGKQVQKEVQKTTRVTPQTVKAVVPLTPDTVRGHAFQFKLWLPTNLRHWQRRAELLSKKNIKYTELKHLFGGGQRLVFKGRIIHLTNKSIIVYEKASFIDEFAKGSKSKAIGSFITLIKDL